jgi:hypothetical protein
MGDECKRDTVCGKSARGGERKKRYWVLNRFEIYTHTHTHTHTHI